MQHQIIVVGTLHVSSLKVKLNVKVVEDVWGSGGIVPPFFTSAVG
jgi:hypothetical protein